MKIFCGKHAGKVFKNCSCKEIREAFYGFISGAILFMNLRVLKTADAAVAIAIREGNKMADEKTSCQSRFFFRSNHSLRTGSQQGRKKIRRASEWESERRDSASEASGTRGSL